jgi:uncharacterized protein
MLEKIIVRTVAFCTFRAKLVVLAWAAIAVASAVYTSQHFAINTDVNKLISTSKSPARQNQLSYEAAFPARKVLVVVEAPTSEMVDQATDRLASALRARANVLRSVEQPDGGVFFQHNALMFLHVQDVERVTGKLARAGPMLGTLASDPSLRGIADALRDAVAGVRRGRLKLDDLAQVLTAGARTLDDILAGRTASFSWRALVQGRSAGEREPRRFIEVEPILNYAALEPGKAATDAIRHVAAEQKLATDFSARVLLTGQVPIDDEQFSTVRGSAVAGIAISVVTVLIELWFALHSWRILLPVAFTVGAGLCATAAFGLLTVGTLNLISISFAVLFIGLGVDFGLQFSVRYRSERYELGELRAALRSTARKAGIPLALAATATAAAFFSFLATDFSGLSELGQIAGSGMLIAFITTITALPAALTLLRPRSEPRDMGFSRLARVDRFTMRHRVLLVTMTLAVVVLASPLLLRLDFDFNPLHLQNPKLEAIATFLKLRGDPTTGANDIDVLTPSLAEGNKIAKRLAGLPEVARAMTLDSLIPEAQDQKLAAIRAAAQAIDPSLNGSIAHPAPTDADNVSALQDAARGLAQVAGTAKGAGADAARHLSVLLDELARAAPNFRETAEIVFAAPLRFELGELRLMLMPQRITTETLPPVMARNWVTPNGEARVEVLPKGNANNDVVLRKFAAAVLAAVPSATGMPVVLQEAASIVVRAFVEAGALALGSIAILLWIALRRISDVLLTLVPLLLAAIVTLEISALIGLELNFANIIALPLLLGVGVAFKIYYIMAWRSGKTNLLQSTLTRAVMVSAATTATAFGSLWLSSQPGLSSMGELMTLSLICTLAAAVLFQPILMGPPRQPASNELERLGGAPDQRRAVVVPFDSATGTAICTDLPSRRLSWHQPIRIGSGTRRFRHAP